MTAAEDIADQKSLNKCGVNFCPWSLTTDIEDDVAVQNSNLTALDSLLEDNFKTTETQIFTLAGIYLAFSLIGPLIIAVFVDPLSK